VIVEMITSQGNDPLTAVSARVSPEQKLRLGDDVAACRP